MSEKLSRRGFVRNGGAGLLAAGLVGTAGCLSDLPVVGDDGEYSAPTLENWLTDVSFEELYEEEQLEEYGYDDPQLEDAETRDREFEHVSTDPIFEHEEELGGYDRLDTWSALRTRIGVPATEIEWHLAQRTRYEWEFSSSFTDAQTEQSTLTIGALNGAFEPDDVERRLENWADDTYPDEGLSREGEYEGFDLYEIEPENRAIAVEGRYVLEANADEFTDPIVAVEAAIDARINQENRLSEDEDVGVLLDRVPSGHASAGTVLPETEDDDDALESNPWLEGYVGGGRAVEFDGSTSSITAVFLYESEGDANPDDLREYVEANRDIGDAFATLEGYSITEADRALLLTGTVRTRAL